MAFANCKTCNATFKFYPSAESLFCSQNCWHKHYKLNGLQKLRKKKNSIRKKILTRKTCPMCSKDFNILNKKVKYCSKSCKRSAMIEFNKKFRFINGDIKKMKLINDFGGRCELCGYSACSRALVFHHKDPSTKLFTLDKSSMRNQKDGDIILEAKKCQLLCQNCHQELHEKIINEKQHLKSKKAVNARVKAIKRKLKIMEKFGNKCNKCGYRNPDYISSITFHHIDRATKKFLINMKTILHKYNNNELSDEINKCEMLCFNCHMEKEDVFLSYNPSVLPVNNKPGSA